MRPNKLRQPNTVEDALLEVYAALGIDTAAIAVGKSEPHLRRWSDPDQESLPSFKQCLLLDAACLRKVGRSPLLEVYGHWMAAIAREEAQESLNAIESVLEVTSGVGRVADEIQHALAPASEGGVEITPNEATKIRKLLTPMFRSMDALDRCLKKRQQPSASIVPLRPKL